MIRIDFTDSEGKYLDSVYYTQDTWEETLRDILELLAGDYKRNPLGCATFAEFVVKHSNGSFLPKPKSVFHFQVI